jgi:AraC-like DNA-binding protein
VSASSATDGHGLLRPWERDRSFTLESRPPSPGLERLVDRHWMVRWNRRGRAPFRQEILPHPSINLVAEMHSVRVWGVPTRRDVRLLADQGWAIGTKFRPGAFTAITGIEAFSITNDSILAPAMLAGALDPTVLCAADDPLAAARTEVEARLAPYADIDDPALELVGAVMASMHDLPPDTRVEQLAARHHVAPRTLQRLFRRYVGVSPRWTLKRLRIHQAVEQLAGGRQRPWTELALELGYYDHAHFIRDFRLVTERSPAEYVREARAA